MFYLLLIFPALRAASWVQPSMALQELELVRGTHRPGRCQGQIGFLIFEICYFFYIIIIILTNL